MKWSLLKALGMLILCGAVSASAQTAPYVRTIIVPSNSTAAANGTALLTAITGISPAPSFSTRWLIKLEPGIYNVGTTPVVLSQYVDIEGSGVLQSIIQGAVIPTAPSVVGGLVQGASNSEIRNLTVNCVSTSGTTTGCQAVSLNSANARLSQVRILCQGTDTGSHWGIRTYDSSPILDDVEINVSTTGTSTNNYGIVYGGSSTLNVLRSSITVFGGSGDNVGIVMRDTPLYSLMRDSSVTAYGGLRAFAVGYISASGSAIVSFDNVILSAHSASTATAGIGVHSGGFPTPALFFRAGRIYSTGSGIEILGADITTDHTEIESTGAAVQGTNINVSFTRLRGTGFTFGSTSAACAANVDAAGVFQASACP